jgi:membrane protein YqaA with SNARE-associated domain
VSVGALIDAVWPYAVMFVSAFVSATLLPFASEAVLVAELRGGLGSTAGLVTIATIGNVAGSTLNWWMGRAVHRFTGRRWFPFKANAIARATERFKRFGPWLLLLSWVPVIGDPLTLVAGILRVPLGVFFTLVTIGKAGRYIVIAWLV